MREHLQKGEMDDFISTYHFYKGIGTASKAYTDYKALALLYLLASQRTPEFFKELQTVTSEELVDDNIRFVLNAMDCADKCDSSELKKLSHEAENDIIRNIMKRLLQVVEEKRMARKSNSETVSKKKDEESTRNVESCVFVCKNFQEN